LARDPLTDQAFETRRQAARVARMIGCSGAHETEEGWFPCASEEALDTIVNHGIRAYRRRFGSKAMPTPTETPKRTKVATTPGVKRIIAEVDEELGALKTFDDYQKAFTEAFPNARLGVDEDITPKQRGGSYALLWKSIEDPATAELVGFLTTGEPNAGIALNAPLRAPLGVVIGDGDSEEVGVVEALHLWGHLAGLAITYEDIDPAAIDAVQAWVNGGGEAPGIPGLAEMEALIPGPEVEGDAETLLSSFGIDETEGRADAALRAVAARIAVGRALIARMNERIAGSDEEELAEMMAQSDIDDDLAVTQMGSDQDEEELERRMR
jgi:hypothetical protein